MSIKTFGDLKKLVKDLEARELDDDFVLDVRFAREIPEEDLREMRYPYPWDLCDAIIEFSDIGYSDKVISIMVYEVDGEKYEN